MLTFKVEGNTGSTGATPYVRLKFDEYETETLEAGMNRLADWLEAAARVLRGQPQAGPPISFIPRGEKQ